MLTPSLFIVRYNNFNYLNGIIIMEINQIDKIVSECIFDNKSTVDPLTITKNVIDECKSLENEITVDKLFELLCNIDTFYKSIGLMKILKKNKNYDQCDKELEEYINVLFSNKKIFKKIKEIKKVNPTNLVNMIYKNFFELKNEKVNKAHNEICKLRQLIINKIEEPIDIIVNKKKINLTNDVFFSLQKKIKDANSRKSIEGKYYQKSEKVLNDLASLIMWRHEYANELNNDTYFEYVKQKGSVESIKELVNDLILKIEDRSRKEIDRVHRELLKDGYNKKVDYNDIIHYYEKLKSTNLFKPVDVLRALLEVSNNLFGINFGQFSFPLKLWSNNVMTCKATYNGSDIGYVHFDMYDSDSKLIKTPLCVKISNSPTRVCLTTGYHDINEKCMTYTDVILLFREFGTVIQMITHNKNELIVKNDEFDILMSQIMEYIAWERPIVEKICKGLDKTIPDHILFTRYINFAHSIKMRCVNSLFDHILHNSSELITMIKHNIKNNISSSDLIKSLYKKIYSDVMCSQQDIINLNIIGINPAVVYQEINGGEGKIYSGILTEILSFTVYTLIKRGRGSEFIENVLSKESFDLRDNLHKFISQLDNDSYDLYLKEVIGYNEIDTEINKKEKNKSKKNSNSIITDTSANYFCDENTIEKDNDTDEIIHFDRKIF